MKICSFLALDARVVFWFFCWALCAKAVGATSSEGLVSKLISFTINDYTQLEVTEGVDCFDDSVLMPRFLFILRDVHRCEVFTLSIRAVTFECVFIRSCVRQKNCSPWAAMWAGVGYRWRRWLQHWCMSYCHRRRADTQCTSARLQRPLSALPLIKPFSLRPTPVDHLS